MVYINMIFSLGHLVIFGGKPEHLAIPDSSRKVPENPNNFGRDRTFKHRFFLICPIG